ncbi:MAG: glycoside hydrolase family 97 protein [Prevotellaceae bacterium]|jgi:hypothetical protein|nr:glycoside hydrolase family 97 protein [Prevotellaceae bacterium]
MKRVFLLLLLPAVALAATAQQRPQRPPQQDPIEQTSPDGALKLTLNARFGGLFYTVTYHDKTILEASPLGLETSLGDFTRGLSYKGTASTEIDHTYTMPRAKARTIDYRATQKVHTYTNSENDTIQIIIQVANNEIALAYRLASPRSTKFVTIEKEATGFNFPAQTTTFITPQAPWGGGFARSKPSYEETYVEDEPIGMRSLYGLGYTFPALFRLGDDGWVLLSETGVSSHYAGTKLSESSRDGIYTISFPEPEENAGIGSATVTASLPMQTSWKTITVGADLKPIVETTSGYNPVAPVYEASTDYKPGKGTWSWILWGDGSCNYDDQVTFIDLAAKAGVEYILIDALWDAQIGYPRMEQLIRYAATKGVGVFLWYNSNGAWNDAPQGPRNRMSSAPARHKEMAWMKSLGVKGIKVDFFGGDKQETMRYYEDILTDANDYGLMVDFHGTTLPRGWERMYPNFVTAEAALVSENLVFGQAFADNEAHTATLLPFIRGTVSSMDWGGVFFNKRFSKDPAERGTFRRTTDAFQVATLILYQSPIQFLGITPQNFTDGTPAFLLDFVRDAPTVWDETRYVAGYPGREVVIARRHGDSWYIAAANGEDKAKKLTLPLSWLAGKAVTVICDQKDGSATQRQATVNKKGELVLEMQPKGGAVVICK